MKINEYFLGHKSKHLTTDLSIASVYRIPCFDAFKCLGIILVIHGHVELFGFGIKNCSSWEVFYSFNMPLFFFISGFFAFKEINRMRLSEWGGKLVSKFFLLVIPALVFTLFYDYANHISPIIHLQVGFGCYWFTIVLFECFLFYYTVIYLFSFNDHLKWGVLILLSLLGIGYLSMGMGDSYGACIELNRLSKYFHFFVVGLLAKKYQDSFLQIVYNEYLKALAIIVFFVLLVAITQYSISGIFGHFAKDIVFRYIGTYIVVSLFLSHKGCFERESRVNRIIKKIGENSLSIYLLQYFFLPDLIGYSAWILGLDEVTMNLICLLYSIIIVALCLGVIIVMSNSIYISKYILGKRLKK